MDKLVTDNNCSRLNSGKHFRVYAFNSAPHCNPVTQESHLSSQRLFHSNKNVALVYFSILFFSKTI